MAVIAGKAARVDHLVACVFDFRVLKRWCVQLLPCSGCVMPVEVQNSSGWAQLMVTFAEFEHFSVLG